MSDNEKWVKSVFKKREEKEKKKKAETESDTESDKTETETESAKREVRKVGRPKLFKPYKTFKEYYQDDAFREKRLKYLYEYITCEPCNVKVRRCALNAHQKTVKHIINAKEKNYVHISDREKKTQIKRHINSKIAEANTLAKLNKIWNLMKL